MGEFYILSASILLALSTVFAHYLIRGLNPLLIVFYSFLIAFIFFNILGLKNNSFFNLVKKNWQWVLFVNISTALDWLLMFVALKYVSAAMINCFIFGIAPIATLILIFKNYKSNILFLKDVLICSIILVLLAILSSIYYSNNTLYMSSYAIKFGILLSCLSGLATGATLYGCKMLQNCGFSTNSVMRSRFAVIIIMALLLLIYNKGNLLLPLNVLKNTILLTFIFIIIPIFLLQKGIELTIPVVTAIISCLIPVSTYIFQFFEPNFLFNWQETIVIILLSLVIFSATIFKPKISAI